MSQFISVILICASTVPVPECSRATARDVMTTRAASQFECLMQGQTIVAGTAMASYLSEGNYLKVVCERPERAARLEPVDPAAGADTALR